MPAPIVVAGLMATAVGAAITGARSAAIHTSRVRVDDQGHHYVAGTGQLDQGPVLAHPFARLTVVADSLELSRWRAVAFRPIARVRVEEVAEVAPWSPGERDGARLSWSQGSIAFATLHPGALTSLLHSVGLAVDLSLARAADDPLPPGAVDRRRRPRPAT